MAKCNTHNLVWETTKTEQKMNTSLVGNSAPLPSDEN